MLPRLRCSQSFARSGVGLGPGPGLGLAVLQSETAGSWDTCRLRGALPCRGMWHVGRPIRGCVKHCEALFRGLGEFASDIVGRI